MKYGNILGKIFILIFGLGIEKDLHTRFCQIYKPAQGISTPALLQKKERLSTSLMTRLQWQVD